eukprot:gene17017-5253_t
MGWRPRISKYRTEIISQCHQPKEDTQQRVPAAPRVVRVILE